MIVLSPNGGMQVDPTTTNLLFLLLGALIGLGSSFVLERSRRKQKSKDRHSENQRISVALVREIKAGIERCDAIAEAAKKGELSASRIYIGFWQAFAPRMPELFRTEDAVKLVHELYYRFDLVNFNVNLERVGNAVAFAELYLPEMRKNLSKLQDYLVGEGLLTIPAPPS